MLFSLLFATVNANEAETEFTIVNKPSELAFGTKGTKNPILFQKWGLRSTPGHPSPLWVKDDPSLVYFHKKAILLHRPKN
jgi:hypothetical protein